MKLDVLLAGHRRRRPATTGRTRFRPSMSTSPSSAPGSPGCPRPCTWPQGASVAVFERHTVAGAPPAATAGWRPPGWRSASGTADRALRRDARRGHVPGLQRRDRHHREARARSTDRLRLRPHGQAEPGRHKPAHYEGLQKTPGAARRARPTTTCTVVAEGRHPHRDRHRLLPRRDGRPARPPGCTSASSPTGSPTPRSQHGAEIHENAAVTELRRVAGTVHDVHTTRGVTRADQVLVATSGYTGRPFPVAAAPDRPGGQLHHRHRAAGRRRGRDHCCRTAGWPRTARTSSTTSGSPRTTGCCSAAGRGSRCPSPDSDVKSGADPAQGDDRRSSRTSPTRRSTTAGAAWST